MFTIAIPAYKKAFLYEAIESCMLQTYNNFEIVIVNDASPEDLAEIVGKFVDPRIRYYRNEKNYGAINVVDNWNICLSYANGDYIICMGDDDKLLPNCLEEYAKLIKKYPGLGVYHAWTEIIDAESNFCALQPQRPEYESAMALAWNRWNGRNKQFIGDFCYDVKQLRQAGGFYKVPLAWGSDDISAVRAAEGKGIANTQVICFQYRENSQTITKNGNNVIKVQASLQEKEWFSKFLLEQRKNIFLVTTDKKYLRCMETEIDKYYSQKIRREIISSMRTKYRMLFYWLKNAPRFGINHKVVCRCFIKAVFGMQ